MIMKTFFSTLFLIVSVSISAQVGIGTTTPQETLHVNGTLRVEKTDTSPATKITGMDAVGTVNELEVGDNLKIESGRLNATGTNKYFVANIDVSTTVSGQLFNDLDLDLQGANRSITAFRLINASHNYRITGITGGEDGRHILLINIPSVNMRIEDGITPSLPENQFVTLKGNFEATSGQGVAELVYDGSLEKWIVVNFRD